MSEINDEEIPPLEDIPNLESLKLNENKKVDLSSYVQASDLNNIQKSESNQITTNVCMNVKEKKDNGLFGGFKKGFLNASTSRKEDKPDISNNKSHDSELIYVKANPSKTTDSKIFSEVKEAIEAENPMWLTDDLLEKIEKNEKLKRGFQNSKLLDKITKFQNNPQAALKECENDKEAIEFIQEYFKLMGTHLTNSNFNVNAKQDNKILTKPQAPSETTIIEKKEIDEEQKKATELLNNNEVRELLMDRDVQNLFMELRSNPENSKRLLRNANNEMQLKIRKLISYGLLNIQS